MSPDNSSSRLKRLKIWVLILTLVPAAALAAWQKWAWCAGLTAGGVLMLVNFLGTERAARGFVGDSGPGKALAVLVQVGKLGLTAAAIALLLWKGKVPPLALLLGLSSLPAALMFDFFIFPVNKGEQRGD